MDAGHPLHEQIWVLEWVTSFPRIHFSEVGVPIIYKFQGEVELPSLHESFIIYGSIISIYMRTSPPFVLCHDRMMGRP